MKDENSELRFSVKVKNPKENAISYSLETMQDIFDAVTVDNIDKFLREFEIVLRSAVLAKYVVFEQNPEATKDMKFNKVVWTDD